MKYYSEKTLKFYDKVEDLQAAEKKLDEARAGAIKREAEKKEAAKAVQKKYIEYAKAANAFFSKYGVDYMDIINDRHKDFDFEKFFNTLLER